jgi:hypothetical protein
VRAAPRVHTARVRLVRYRAGADARASEIELVSEFRRVVPPVTAWRGRIA